MNATTVITERNTTETALIMQWNLSHWNNHIFLMNFLPSFVYILLLLMIGVVGNALVCYVYHFKIRNKRSSSNIFILALSWFDLINCTLSLPFELVLISNFVQFDQPTLCKLSRFITFFCNNSTSVILLAIAIDRLRGFLSGPRLLRLKSFTSKIIVGLAMFISALISWPMLLFFGTLTFPLQKDVVGHTCSIIKQYVNSVYIQAFTVSLLCLHLCFDLSFIIIYSIIGKRICYESETTRRMSESSDRAYSVRQEIRKGSDSSTEDDVFVTSIDGGRQSSIKRISSLLSKDKSANTELLSSTNSSQTSIGANSKGKDQPLRTSFVRRVDTFRNSIISHIRQKQSRCSSSNSEWRIFNRRPTVSRTSLMLFLVTVAYIISFLPYCVLVVIRTVNPTFDGGLNNLEKSMYQLLLRSYCLSSAVNPIIYSFVNSSFRRKCKEALKDMVCCLKRRKSR